MAKFFRTADINKIPKGLSGVAYSRKTGRQTTIEFAKKNPDKTFISAFELGEMVACSYRGKSEAIFAQLETEAAKRLADAADRKAKRLQAAADKVIPKAPAKKVTKKAPVKKAVKKTAKKAAKA